MSPARSRSSSKRSLMQRAATSIEEENARGVDLHFTKGPLSRMAILSIPLWVECVCAIVAGIRRAAGYASAGARVGVLLYGLTGSFSLALLPAAREVTERERRARDRLRQGRVCVCVCATLFSRARCVWANLEQKWKNNCVGRARSCAIFIYYLENKIIFWRFFFC